MDPPSFVGEANRWQLLALDEIFKALASSRDLSQQLIYKGARVLRLRLQEELRASFDIDASLANFSANVEMATDEDSREKIRRLVHRAIETYFEGKEPVRYELKRSTITHRRKSGPHPRGWDIYWLELDVRDLMAETTGAIPGQLRIDIAAAEKLSERSVSPIELDGRTINAITLERIAGEKLRAFLSSLPFYRDKIRDRTLTERRRVKDLYDVVRIVRRQPVIDGDFWNTVGVEFRLACESRCIDCGEFMGFKQDWDETRKLYAADKTLPTDVTFDQVETTLDRIIQFLSEKKIVPFSFDLPEIDERDGDPKARVAD
jgi:transcriptional regulator with XRE-family HTH domain